MRKVKKRLSKLFLLVLDAFRLLSHFLSGGYSQIKKEQSNMGYGNREKPERNSARAGFVEARIEELRRRWENATDEREKTEVSEQIREWQSFRPERSAPSGGRR
jgi:hypothetical protein